MFLNNKYRPYLQDFDKFVAYFDSLARKCFEMGPYEIFLGFKIRKPSLIIFPLLFTRVL